MINDRPTQLRVNLDALLNNYNKLNSLNNEKIGLAVVKADSYGLGSKVIAEHLYQNGVRHFATATLEEALELKDVIKDSMVLVLGVINSQNVKYAVENNVSLTCPSKEWLEESLVHLQQIEGKLKIHVKLDTGMGRIGTSDLEELKEIDNLLDSEKIDFEGIFSHYSNADGEDDNYDNYQTENFERSLKIFTHKPKYIHIENSAGTVKYSNRDDQYNLTRIGIAMYGCYPSGNIEKLDKVQLEPVASLVSKVTHVKKFQAGQKLGYGVSYEAKQDEYIATVPIGYADGLLRRAQGFKIRVGSEECEIVGRVCMDQLMVRCSKNVKVGDDVLFFGEYSGQKVSVDEFAEYQNTISYEIFCCINKRVPRVYYKNKMEL
ncbi:alanine racemase [Gemella haemolysans]|jgi:alanine racemase|uniref:Alanine racemase n=2 Tax=Gemella haemolysans TaxID=1379 RepID=A0AA87AYN5_9BACL|nr:alanine racemase [Gemella haemolysans]EGF87219.1 alanine racemase [Gemella haemolysans M341]QIX88042.1 alanine racemase [Gemella haemolysans]